MSAKRKAKFRVGQKVWWIAGRSVLKIARVTKEGFITPDGWLFYAYEARPLTRRERGA